MAACLLLIYCFLYLQLLNLSQSQTVCGGNAANNAQCVFPFTYEEISFYEPTTHGRERPWCATTSDYDEDGIWGYTDGCDVTPTPTYTTSDPLHYSFTRGNINNGTLKVMVVKLIYDGQEDIDSANWTNWVAPSNDLFYADSSWGKLKFDWTFLPKQYVSSFDPDTIKNGMYCSCPVCSPLTANMHL